MTNPERPHSPNSTELQADIGKLRELLASWYSDDEEFAYKTNDGWAILTVDELLQICGDKIAPLPEEAIKGLFDKYRGYVELIRSKGEDLVEEKRAVGKAVLERYQ